MKLFTLLVFCLATIVSWAQSPPVAICQDITIQLDGSGMASIIPSDVDSGSFDPDGDPITLSLDIDTFTCSELGANTVTLTVTDIDGVDTCMATVTVEDAPAVAICQDITIQLDALGMATINVGDLDAGSTGTTCGGTITISDSNFDCADVFNPPSTDLILTGIIDGPIPVGGAIQIVDYQLTTGVEYYLVTSGYAAGDV